MKVSDRGAFAIAAHEGLVPTRYKDIAGVDTWGIGHTDAAGDPLPSRMSYDMPSNPNKVYEEAWAVFLEDLERYTKTVVDRFGPNLKQNELDGLVSWHFNTGGAYTSNAVRHWRNGDKERAMTHVKAWNKYTDSSGKKRISSALVARRKEEERMIMRGVYPSTAMPVYPTNGRGRVIWAPTEVFTFGDWLKFLGRGPVKRVVQDDPMGVASGIAVVVGALGTIALVAQEKIQEGWQWLINLW